MGAHHDDALESVREGLIAAGFPVVGRVGLLAQHHGRAMGEEVYGWGRHGDVCVCVGYTLRSLGRE